MSNRTHLDFEHFHDTYEVLPSPFRQYALDYPFEVDGGLISVQAKLMLIDWEEEHPNTVWSVVRSSDEDYEPIEDDEDYPDDEYDMPDVDEDDIEEDYIDETDDVEDQINIEDEEFDVEGLVASIVPGISDVEVLCYLITKVPYEDSDEKSLDVEISF